MPLTIRAATAADVPEMHSMIRELAEFERELDKVVATEADLRQALFVGPAGSDAGPALHGHVAEVDGAVVGMALWFLSYSTWTGTHGIYLEDLFVRPAARGLGVGTALLETLAGICVERGYHRMAWSVLDWNESAIAFYRSIGAGPMSEWTTYRLADEKLAAFGDAANR